MAGGLRAPGPSGAQAIEEPVDKQTGARAAMPAPGKPATPQLPPGPPLDEDTRQLAATAYGESSAANVFEEMAAIANVLVRQAQARGYKRVASFIAKDKTFAFAAHDGNPRYGKFIALKLPQDAKDAGVLTAIKAARNALLEKPVDYAAGAYFWDGDDIKTNYDKHAKVRAGISFGDASHNIYKIAAKDVPGEAWWLDKDGKKTKLRGQWTYKFVSTAAFGGSIFWKYSADFIAATGNKVYD